METQPEVQAIFENIGVDISFEIRIPKATLDSSNAVVAAATSRAHRTVYPGKLSGTNIVKVTITGGSGEGEIINICSS